MTQHLCTNLKAPKAKLLIPKRRVGSCLQSLRRAQTAGILIGRREGDYAKIESNAVHQLLRQALSAGIIIKRRNYGKITKARKGGEPQREA